MKSLEKRIRAIEDRLPRPEDVEAQKQQQFLENCTDQELDLLIKITEDREDGNEPALSQQEEEMWAALEARWNTAMRVT